MKFKYTVFCLVIANCLIAQVKTKTDSIIDFATKHVGVKYKYASANPKKGFDCSGFVNFVFSEFGVQVPRSSKLFNHFGINVELDSCKKGDVLLFEKPGHVGIVTYHSKDSLRFIHASSDKRHGGVKISEFYSFSNYKKRFVKVIRIPNF
ncbi:MAG: C40 family peptidase [Bacteroidota bacterium]|jgi:cell wall-associated NlpC family hydrolase|nr:C40 family peptidase [Bacteroidota bacterium]MCA6444443.1 C40 family peptidase [Bacteroidota bacterium]